jgi:hypothetical protein
MRVPFSGVQYVFYQNQVGRHFHLTGGQYLCGYESAKGVWYRGPFEHNVSVATLEDWFDPHCLKMIMYPPDQRNGDYTRGERTPFRSWFACV